MSMGKMYEYMGQHDKPTYPTLWQRIIAWWQRIVAWFLAEKPPVCDEGINLVALTCVGDVNVSKVLDLLYAEGLTPTIVRDTDKWQGHYVKVTRKENFLKVADGHNVLYFPLTVDELSLYDNPFYNVERIISVTGERDDIHKKAKRKDASAEAA